MSILKHITTAGVALTVLSVYSACSGLPGRHQARGETEGAKATIDYAGAPEVWIHGMGGAPDKAAEIHARGVRQIVNLRGADPKDLNKFFTRYVNYDMGLCLTLRWAESEGDEGKSRTDKPPSPSESREAMDGLIEALNSEPAKKLAGRLWIQFYNEYLGGPGTFAASDDDRLFQWATDASRRIRAEAPHVRLCGPAMIAVEVLDENPATLPANRAERRERLVRGLNWSIQNTDAVDVHLHTDSGASAEARLAAVRRIMDQQPGGDQCGIVVWEWSASKSKNHEAAAARQTTIDIYNAMAKYNVIAAAYSQYHVPKRIADRFGWVTLTDEKGNPRQPFYSLFMELADGQVGAQSTNPQQVSPAQDKPNPRIRRRRNRRVVDPATTVGEPVETTTTRKRARLVRRKKNRAK